MVSPNMCEWLSCREWCDVQLLCGGRKFSAHRAVLASVSFFLRNVLLSCPTEELPTLIVLPDFDLEALSSVLYYIYNGEVIIHGKKLDMFLDLVKALQIFIDDQYLSKANNNGLEDVKIHSNNDEPQRSSISKNTKVFTIRDSDCKDYQMVNIKKGKQIQDIFTNYSLNDCENKLEKCQRQQQSEHRTAYLRNLQSAFEDRQKSSFLRDLFTETYPRNGNANGRAAGVLAISNEGYREPTSVLLANANDKHPKVDDTVLQMPRETPVHTSRLSTVHALTRLHRHATIDDTYNSNANICNMTSQPTQFNFQLRFDNCYVSGTNSQMNALPFKPNEIPLTRNEDENKRMHCLMHSIDQSVSTCSKSDVTRNQYLAESQILLSENVGRNYEDNITVNSITDMSKTSSLAKGTILNQVMESPWCPRLPNNYRPFRKKELKVNSSLNLVKAKLTNDSNNNIKTSESFTKRGIMVTPSKTTDSVPGLVDDVDYKCSVCNQVFTSSESLATHTRRHSTVRYTCGECSKSFSQLRNFKYHMSVHRGTREFAATCTVCGKYFNDRGYLSSHMKIHRNRKEYKCSLCPKSFNQRVAYNMHVRIHTGIKPHVCSECGKAFSRKMLLKQHQRTHSGERPYACPHCDKRFADRSNMTLHLRLHTGVKPFSCSMCPKSFTKKHHLKSHLNFHTGAKPYSCPRCRLAFTQSSNMRTHLKKCTAPEIVYDRVDT